MRRFGKGGLWLAFVVLALALPIAVGRYNGVILANAIRAGNLQRLKPLANLGDINTKSKNGTTVLMVAAEAGDLAYVRELIARGADVNAANEDDHAALYWAAKAGRLEVVRELLRSGAVLKPAEGFARDWDTPRAAAKTAGHLKVAQLLAERERLSGQLLRETRKEWTDPPRGGFDAKRLTRWEGLLARGASPHCYDINGDSLFALIAATDEPGVRLLLKHGASPRFQSRSFDDPMCVAVSRGSLGMLKDLLDHGGSPDGGEVFRTPLGYAVGAGRVDLARLLLDRGADPNRKYLDRSPLSMAQKTGRKDLIALLKSGGARE